MILGLTAAAKLFVLVHGSELLAQPHPFLPGTYEIYIWLALAAELTAFAFLAFAGARAFLLACLGLAILFIAYHAIDVGLQVGGPGPSLGGLLGHWRPLTEAESALSFLLACGLGISSFVGLFPASQKSVSAPPRQSAALSTGVAVSSWLVAGGLILWFWKGRALGGDEGMEAAISLQLLAHAGNINRIWNDQLPLLTELGAQLFRLFGHSLTVGRVGVVLIGCLFPFTVGIYCARAGAKWAGAVAVVFLWLLVPVWYGSFMLEAPAYCAGISALLPLVLLGFGRVPLCVSALLAAFALSIKFTAAFALVVPFIWLLQRSWRTALLWGFLAVGLTILTSFVEPGWSWSTIAASHLDFSAPERMAYRFDPLIYAQGWLVCAFAVFAVAGRYVKNQLGPIIPWLSAVLAALFILIVHRPFWGYYDVELITPVAVLAGLGVVDLWRLPGAANISQLERRMAITGTTIICFLWIWQQEIQIGRSHTQAEVIAASPVVKELKALGKSGKSEFSMDPLWTFAADQPQTPPELTIIPLKRVWSREISDTIIAQSLASNRVDAIVLHDSALKESAWSNLLSNYVPTARDGTDIVFVRRDLDPKPIDLGGGQAAMLKRLGL
ncbi:MAG TPA: hypothetical protein VMH30_13925 [Verrucomicrobiae bacterium]|nr:hypothetical protein [Verrucomicrobiae bacterium]